MAETDRKTNDAAFADNLARAPHRRGWRTALSGLVVLSVASVFAGFVIFANHVTRDARATGSPTSADAIVVLTGSSARIAESGRLLSEGRGRRLLVSGANPRASRADIRRLTGLSDRLFACCVDIGYRARDTVGNGAETRDWIARNGFQSILVVTSARHMPRGLTELARASPATNFHAAPVHPRGRPSGPWWTNAGQVRLLLQEYVKFLPSAGRYLITRARAALEGETLTSPRSPDGAVPAGRNTLTSS